VQPRSPKDLQSTQGDTLPEPKNTTKFDISQLPKEASDNFLIEFKGRKPTYDQLFEYTIDEKPHMKEKNVPQSFVSTNFQISLQKKFDVSIDAFKKIMQRFIHRVETQNQQYRNRRHGILGN